MCRIITKILYILRSNVQLLQRLRNKIFAQLLAVEQIGIAYVCSDFFLCILNLHALYQFRMMQQELSKIWSGIEQQTTSVAAYTRGCHVALKKCIRRHQSLIEFCNKLEQVFTFPILSHVVVFSLLMCFDTYEILLVIFLISFLRTIARISCYIFLIFIHCSTRMLMYSWDFIVAEDINISKYFV